MQSKENGTARETLHGLLIVQEDASNHARMAAGKRMVKFAVIAETAYRKWTKLTARLHQVEDDFHFGNPRIFLGEYQRKLVELQLEAIAEIKKLSNAIERANKLAW